MKPKNIAQLIMMLCASSPLGAFAQFNSGSTGADGPLVVTNSLIMALPTNGIFNFTTITVASGATLTFNRNPLNTPVYLLATGDVVVDGRIIVDGGDSGNPLIYLAGKGGPGGFDGGFGENQVYPAGNGQGPGGGFLSGNGNSIHGVFGTPISGNTNTYANTLLSPQIGGSGGSGQSSYGGGGGGGALLIASSSRITIRLANGIGGIYARGGCSLSAGGCGSGGAIRIIAPIVEGNGLLVASGGGITGPGRMRIDTLDRFAWRSLRLGDGNIGRWTVGSQMFVFPPGNPHLDIINAAGTPIIEGANAPVIVTLPIGSSTNQLVRVQARGFTNDIPIRVKITPENAPSATFDGTIQQSSGNPPFADVQVTLPVDTVCHVHAWTR